MISKFFATEKDISSYLKKNVDRYENFYDARKKDKKMRLIQYLMKSGKVKPDFAYDFFRRDKCWSKQDWVSYLSKTHKKYASLREFINVDSKGSALKQVLYTKGRNHVITSKDIFKLFWKKSPKSNLREIKAMNQFAKQIKKMSFTKDLKQEVFIGKRSRVDIVLTLNSGRVVLIEGKHDASQWTKIHTSEQIQRYAKLGKKNFGNKYHKTILCSPNGKYGISFKEVISVLKKVA